MRDRRVGRRRDEAQQPPRGRLALRGEQRVAAEEVALVELHREAKAPPRRGYSPASARGPRRDSPSPAAATRSRSSRHCARRGPRPPASARRRRRRHIRPARKAPSQARPHRCGATASTRRAADADLADRAERKRRVVERRLGEPRQQVARARPHHGDHRIGRGHVGQRRVHALRQMAADPVGVARRLRGAGDEQEAVGAQGARRSDRSRRCRAR